jgi:ubiquinone/menaquinone biosynthesis C-methylase UbiE
MAATKALERYYCFFLKHKFGEILIFNVVDDVKDRRRLWNSLACDYDVIWEVADYSPILHSVIEEVDLDSGLQVVDVAAGTGAVGLEVASKVGHRGNVTCVDYSKSMLERAVEKARLSGVSNVGFVLADAQNLPFVESCFDLVTCCWGFSFFPSPHAVAEEMRRITKPNSKVAVVEWEKQPVNFWLDLRMKAGIRDFEESELICILNSAGFRNVCTRKIQISHRKPEVPPKSIKKSQLYVLSITGLREEDGAWFFKRISDEYRQLPLEKKHWLPILYVGVKY